MADSSNSIAASYRSQMADGNVAPWFFILEKTEE
jgi:hypothetical protein